MRPYPNECRHGRLKAHCGECFDLQPASHPEPAQPADLTPEMRDAVESFLRESWGDNYSGPDVKVGSVAASIASERHRLTRLLKRTQAEEAKKIASLELQLEVACLALDASREREAALLQERDERERGR